jgi:drug/metabolite transporter (DMT)-like permease
MQRWFGALLIILGCAIMVVEVPAIDEASLPVTPSHGIHLSDFLGGVVVLVGIAVLWTAPPR